MAKYATGTASGAGAGNNFLVALMAHMVANGWTEHDVISSTPGLRDVVMRSGPMSVTSDLRAFVRFTQTTTTSLYALGYSDWDTTTHAGVNVCGASGTTTFAIQDASFSYVFWANNFAVFMAAKIGGVWVRAYHGFVRRGLAASRSGVHLITTAKSIGNTNIPLTGGQPSDLKAGQKVVVMNYAHASGSANAANAEVVTISSLFGNGINVSALTKAYDAGAVVGAYIPPLIISVGANSGTLPGGTTHSPLHLDGTRTSATGQPNALNNTVLASEAFVDPDDTSLEYGSGVTNAHASTVGKQGLRGYTYGAYCCAGGAQAVEDIMDDGDYTFLLLGISTADGLIVGPREV